ncbi:MAG: hypothetical protein J6V25_10390 [Oscillospiraceae bacterium]|nr:hypothetical protein [Oscillospiraceae bacterium]
MSVRKGRYGMSCQDVNNLYNKWGRKSHWGTIRYNGMWESFNDFLYWCSQNGYKKGLILRKKDSEKPHGPDNSYWYDKEADAEQHLQKLIARRSDKCQMCRECTKECDAHGGCKAWKDWFVMNWNKNIRIFRKLYTSEQQQTIRQKFQYEHPDMIREGIRFDGNTV